MNKTIFVVDDNITNLEMATEVLESDYRVLTMTSAEKMFSMLKKITPDMILLDIEMPDMSGMEALVQLKENPEYPSIPVIFLTSMTSPHIEKQGFECGAVDFIGKPFSPQVLKSRLKTHLNIDDIVRSRTQELFDKTEQLEKLKTNIIAVLAELIENRDKGTGGHIERVTAYTKVLIEAMLKQNVYAEEVKNWDLELTYVSTKMHDIGKLSITDFILNKPGKLTDEEFQTMQSHVVEGVRMIEEMAEKTGSNDFLKSAYLFAAYHHEKWNGTGYPFKLTGKDIPLQGRIMAVVDVYDALTSERPYKKAFTSDEAANIIKEDAGTHFDPAIADIFYNLKDAFDSVRVELASKKSEHLQERTMPHERRQESC